MGPSRRDQCALWITGIRFCDAVEWRSQRGSVRTRCEPPIPSCLGMKVRDLVV